MEVSEEEVVEDLWDEELARRRARMEWIAFWIVTITATIIAAYAILKKESWFAPTETTTPAPVSSGTPVEQLDDVDIFPDPMVGEVGASSSLNIDLNNDGTVDEAEAKNGHRTFDKNGNGHLDGLELHESRSSLRYTNSKLLEKYLDRNNDGKISVGERWQALKQHDSNQDGDLGESELKLFWQSFVKRTYAGKAWEILNHDAPEPLEAVKQHAKTESKGGRFTLEDLDLEFLDGKTSLLNPTTAVVQARFSMKETGVARVDFFLIRKSGKWIVLDSWIREPNYSCPRHPKVISPTARDCPFDQTPLQRVAPK